MGQVTVGINGRSYTVGCDNGQEDHVSELAAYLDHHITELKEAMGSVGYTRLILLAGLMVADELSQTVAKLEELEGKVEGVKESQDAVVDKSNGFEAQAVAAKRIESPGFLWDRDPPIRYRKEITDSWIEITLSEGRNRQVRRMTAAVGLPTLRLIRYSIGPWTLDGLTPGQSREISTKEAWSSLLLVES